MSTVLPIVDLRPDHWKIVLEALQRHVPDREVLAFGSRATWTAKDHSDLDLAIMGEEPLPPGVRSALDEEFIESVLPFRVDIVDWARVEDYFRRIIRQHAVALQSPDNVRCTPQFQHKSSSGPTDWVIRRIGEIGEIVGGGTPSTKDASYFGGDIPWLTPRDLSGRHDRRIRYGARNLSKKGLDSCSARIVPPDTILLTTRAPVGYVAIAANSIATNQEFRNIIVNTKHHPDFLYYWLKANTYELERHATGSTFNELSGSALKEIQIYLPKSISEQRAIARVLGTLDDKIELNRRMNTTLEAMSQALFKSWFIDFDPVRAKMEGRDTDLPKHIADLFPGRLMNSELGEIPEGWEAATLGDVTHKPQYGYTASANSEHIGPKFLRITDINKNSWISWDFVPYCDISAKDFSKYRLCKGDLLIARMADPGHGVLVEEEQDAVFASYLIRFRPRKDFHAHFLQYWLRSTPYWKLVKSRATGTTRKKLNARVLSSFSLVIPPDLIGEKFSHIISANRGVVLKNSSEIQSLTKLCDALLPQLVSGKIRVNQVRTEDKPRYLSSAI